MLASKQIKLTLHIISDNPYEDIHDKYETLLFFHDVVKAIKKRSTVDVPIEVYDHKLMFYPGARLYQRAMQDGFISNDYIENVLLKRNTMRTYAGDADDDAFVVSLFNVAVKKGIVSWIAFGVFKILRVKTLFGVMVKHNLVRRGYLLAENVKAFVKMCRLKVPLKRF
jgi:hypothetical protein